MLTPSIDPWLCQHMFCLPSMRWQLDLWIFCSMLAFASVALVIAIAGRLAGSKAFALLYFCRSGIGNGITFPVAALFVFYPFSRNVHGLFSSGEMLKALVVGSATVAALQVYALLRGP